uniref:Putative ovule protein n=1 Tax=Solanum chacoense TaxID=4108 RepID=A0A0V0H620_SOLCH
MDPLAGPFKVNLQGHVVWKRLLLETTLFELSPQGSLDAKLNPKSFFIKSSSYMEKNNLITNPSLKHI